MLMSHQHVSHPSTPSSDLPLCVLLYSNIWNFSLHLFNNLNLIQSYRSLFGWSISKSLTPQKPPNNIISSFYDGKPRGKKRPKTSKRLSYLNKGDYSTSIVRISKGDQNRSRDTKEDTKPLHTTQVVQKKQINHRESCTFVESSMCFVQHSNFQLFAFSAPGFHLFLILCSLQSRSLSQEGSYVDRDQIKSPNIS